MLLGFAPWACSEPVDPDRAPAHWIDPLEAGASPSSGTAASAGSDPGRGSNVLVLLTDDQGIDKIGAYHAHPEPPPTPHMDALAAEGVLFRRAYAQPVCSPTRAALLTGRYNNRYGLGEAIFPLLGQVQLPLSEVTLPEALAGAGYHAEALGKWHLSSYRSDDGVEHPLAQGFAHHAGTMGNLEATGPFDGPVDYFHWEKITDGAASWVDRFATTDTVDDAIERVGRMPEPWLLWVAFHAPHAPMTAPPDELHDYALDATSPIPEQHAALVQSLDTEIGRLLDSMSPDLRARTTIVLLGDNGTWQEAVTPPWRRSQGKNTPFEGGIRVPLVVSGPAVVDPGRETDALVHAVDLFPTLVELAGLDPAALVDHQGAPLELDGVSFLPQLRDPGAPGARAVVYAGKFGPNGPPDASGGYAKDWDIVLDERWKLIRQDGVPQLYDLDDPHPNDGFEGRDLLRDPLTPEAQLALERLSAELVAIEARATFEWQQVGSP